jgi:long-chain acyl-CoA synthetase
MSRNHVAQTVAELPFLGAERFGGRPAQRVKRDGAWQDLSYAALRDVTGEIAQGLVALGVQPGDRVCVLSDTRPEWVQAEFGISAVGGVVVPILCRSNTGFAG